MGGPGPSNAQLETDCARRIPSSWDGNEPRVRFFHGWGCSSHEKSYEPGQYARLHDDPYKMGDWVDSILVPPNMSVTGYHHHDYKGGSATWGPGIHADLNSPNKGVGRRQMSAMKIDRRKSWPEFLRDCCQGIEPANLCKNYAGPFQQACQPNMAFHCGLDLNWFKSPICRQWCTQNKSTCDGIANKLCNGSTDPYCACFNSASNIIRPACFDSACSAGTAYQTEQQMNSAQNCGQFCQMQFNIDKVGRDALLENNTFMQKCGAEANQILANEEKIEQDKIAQTEAKKKIDEEAIQGQKENAAAAFSNPFSSQNSSSTAAVAAIGGGGVSGLSSSMCFLLIIIAVVAYMLW